MTRLDAINRLQERGIRPSPQRLEIMWFLMSHPTHPTVEDVFQSLSPEVPTLSKTTVYNTLRLFWEHGAAQMLTLDDHHICYDGNITPHVHFYCKRCGSVIDLMHESAPKQRHGKALDGNLVHEAQLCYKGICRGCLQEDEKQTKDN